MKFLEGIKNMGKRLSSSNNRSLGTVFGCLLGLVVGIIYVIDGTASLAIIGKPDSIVKSILAVFLSAGTGGNLGSYIGGTIDIALGERTILSFFNSNPVPIVGQTNRNNVQLETENMPSPEFLNALVHTELQSIKSILPKDIVGVPGLYFMKKATINTVGKEFKNINLIDKEVNTDPVDALEIRSLNMV